MKRTDKNRLLKIILQLLFTGVALYFVFTRIPFQDVWLSMQNANLFYLLIALFFYNISKLSNVLRMDRYYRHMGIKLPLMKHVKLYYVGMFYNLFLPGSISGDGYKIYLLKDYQDASAKKLFQATLLDRLSGMSVLVWLASVFLMFSKISENYPVLVYLGWIGILLIFPVLYIFSNTVFPKFKSVFFSALGYSFAVQLLQLVCALFLLSALGIQSYYYDYLCFFLISNAMTIIPISIGGIGIRELVMLYGIQYSDIVKDQAVAFTLMFFATTAITSLVGLIFTLQVSREFKPIAKIKL